jgi:sigma-B regulation protein RsbU (phosphoserine phosphatase)
MDLLSDLEQQGISTPVMVMTAWSSFDLAVEAMRRGACDFIQKPWDNDRLVAAIRKQAESERRRKSELEIAANVQQKLFPRKLRPMRTVDYAGQCLAAREVGGDYYDFLEITDHSLGFVLADVSGKGVPAALLMANLQASFRNQSPGALLRPSDVLGTVNRHFFESTTAERFATLFFGIYDDGTRRIRYVNCAHCSPLLLRVSGEVVPLDATATMLGAFQTWKCKEASADLGRGDTLLLYSDGVTEAGIEHGDEFGEERLTQVLRSNVGLSAAALVQKVIDEVSEFSGASRGDDVTVVALKGI